MAEDQDAKEEKFELDATGQAIAYISLNQARVQAIEHARDNVEFYGPRCREVTLAWEVISEEEEEDYYDIRLSFRPAGRFRGEPGVEQFVIDKTGEIRVRQLLDEPLKKGPPVLMLSAAGVLVAGLVAVGALFATGTFGGNGGPSVASDVAAGAPPTPSPVVTPIPGSSPPASTLEQTVNPSLPTAAPLPSPTLRPRSTPAARPEATPNPAPPAPEAGDRPFSERHPWLLPTVVALAAVAVALLLFGVLRRARKVLPPPG